MASSFKTFKTTLLDLRVHTWWNRHSPFRSNRKKLKIIASFLPLLEKRALRSLFQNVSRKSSSGIKRIQFHYGSMNRGAAARLTISSPLEAHKAHTLVFDSIGVDVGFENPVFACLDMDYEDADADPTG